MSLHAVIEVTHAPIATPALELPSREIGARLEFFGIVRERENDTPLTGLHYEAHEPMARKYLLRHMEEIRKVHPCEAVHFIHRLGWVPVTEASLFVRVLSAHRGEALGFLAELITRLKTDVPIWKSVAQ